MLQIRRVWPAQTSIDDPTLADVQTVVRGMTWGAKIVLQRYDEPDRGEYYFQCARSPKHANFWQVEVRLGGEETHFVTRTSDPAVVGRLAGQWMTNEDRLPESATWARFVGLNVEAQRPFQLTAFIAGPGVLPPWDPAQWLQLAPELKVFSRTARGRASFWAGRRGMRTDNQQPSGGSGKLLLKPPWIGPPGERNLCFDSVRVIAPSYSTCSRQGIAPDRYFHAREEFSGASPGRFSILVALAEDMEHDGAAQLLDLLHRMTDPVLVARKTRPWALSSREQSYNSPLDLIDAVGSTTTTSVAELHEDRPVRDMPHQEKWHAITETF